MTFIESSTKAFQKPRISRQYEVLRQNFVEDPDLSVSAACTTSATLLSSVLPCVLSSVPSVVLSGVLSNVLSCVVSSLFLA